MFALGLPGGGGVTCPLPSAERGSRRRPVLLRPRHAVRGGVGLTTGAGRDMVLAEFSWVLSWKAGLTQFGKQAWIKRVHESKSAG